MTTCTVRGRRDRVLGLVNRTTDAPWDALRRRDIDYNPGTYICLLLNKNHDQEVAHFRHDLRLILSNTTGQNHLMW